MTEPRKLLILVGSPRRAVTQPHSPKARSAAQRRQVYRLHCASSMTSFRVFSVTAARVVCPAASVPSRISSVRSFSRISSQRRASSCVRPCIGMVYPPRRRCFLTARSATTRLLIQTPPASLTVCPGNASAWCSLPRRLTQVCRLASSTRFRSFLVTRIPSSLVLSVALETGAARSLVIQATRVLPQNSSDAKCLSASILTSGSIPSEVDESGRPKPSIHDPGERCYVSAVGCRVTGVPTAEAAM